MRTLAFHLGSFVIFAIVAAACGYAGIWVSKKSGRWWIGVICFLALLYGSATFLVFEGLPTPGGGYVED